MDCGVIFEGEEADVSQSWLEETQRALYEHWSRTTGHRPDSTSRSWACKVYHGCRTCNEHLSLPCSLAQEANEIAWFLNTNCYAEKPATFLRFYLITLSEFVGQLHVLGKHVIGITIGKPPKELCVWANRWAKHRLQILAQHHPMMFFADKYRDKWREYASRLTTEPFVDRCGNEFPALIIDTDWLEKHDSKRKIDDLDEANGPARAVILVPPFRGFLDQAIGYFDEFVSACLSESEKIKRFESKHVHPGC